MLYGNSDRIAKTKFFMRLYHEKLSGVGEQIEISHYSHRIYGKMQESNLEVNLPVYFRRDRAVYTGGTW